MLWLKEKWEEEPEWLGGYHRDDPVTARHKTLAALQYHVNVYQSRVETGKSPRCISFRSSILPYTRSVSLEPRPSGHQDYPCIHWLCTYAVLLPPTSALQTPNFNPYTLDWVSFSFVLGFKISRSSNISNQQFFTSNRSLLPMATKLYLANSLHVLHFYLTSQTYLVGSRRLLPSHCEPCRKLSHVLHLVVSTKN